MENAYRGYAQNLTIIGYAHSIKEFIENQVGFRLVNAHEVELVNGEWENVMR
jgi:hypothetical protein